LAGGTAGAVWRLVGQERGLAGVVRVLNHRF
jgi:hypothetical protein